MGILPGISKVSYKFIVFPITFRMIGEKSQFPKINLNLNTTVKAFLEILIACHSEITIQSSLDSIK